MNTKKLLQNIVYCDKEVNFLNLAEKFNLNVTIGTVIKHPFKKNTKLIRYGCIIGAYNNLIFISDSVNTNRWSNSINYYIYTLSELKEYLTMQ